MAETLLSAVNRVLKRVNVIAGEDGELTSLTDSARQTYIDLAVAVTNEAIQELYSFAGMPLPQESANATITLVTGTRSYAIPTDLVGMRWPLINQTTGDRIWEYPGGFTAIRNIQTIPSQYTGLPQFATISPVNNELYMDNIPTSAENGDEYDLLYDKSLLVSLPTDTFPFNDDTLIALIPALAQLWKDPQRKSFDGAIFQSSLGRAAGFINSAQPRRSW